MKLPRADAVAAVCVAGAIHGGCLRNILLVVVSFLLIGSAFAQKNDVALTGGGYLEVTNPLNLGAAWALEGSYARRFAGVPLLSLSWDLPVLPFRPSPASISRPVTVRFS